ncbi:MAG: chemotaxis protein CheW [Turneriella sp.]|nr:chemotaxis protein CheW [Turneriella sp.]
MPPVETTLKIGVTLLDGLIDTTGEIVLVRNALLRHSETLKDATLSSLAKKLDYLITGLQDKVMKTRLQKLGTLFQRLVRAVREAAQLTGKQVDFQTEGAEHEIDKSILDELADPLIHLVRNAVDHGIEPPEERQKTGKPMIGKIRVQANMREGNVVVQISDDGRGLDPEKIRQTAIRKGLLSVERAAQLTPEETTELVFLPGFSTKEEATTLSGRGVGMDVVRTNIRKLGGTIEISSTPGHGTIVRISLPQTLAILTCLALGVDGLRFVIPRQNIAEVLPINPERLHSINGKLTYELRGRHLPLVGAQEIFGFKATEPKFIVVVKTEKYHYGLVVEAVMDTEEVVVKPIPRFSESRQLFSGAAIMGDGSVAPILDVSLAARFTGLQQSHQQIERTTEVGQTQVQKYLLVRIGQHHVAIPASAMPRLEKVSPEQFCQLPGRKTLNYNGTIIPVIETTFSTSEQVHTNQRSIVVLLRHSDKLYALPVDQVLELTNIESDLRREESDPPEIAGYTIWQRETVVVLDTKQILHTAALPDYSRKHG